MTARHYSHLFSCLHDEPEPVGRLGRGSHHSVFRSVQWFGLDGTPRKVGRIHDFAVIWDEDHDTRIIQVIERMHMAGLLWPVIFIGERKGCLTILTDHSIVPDLEDEKLAYHQRVRDIAESADDTDSWLLEFGWFHRREAIEEGSLTNSMAIIADYDTRSVPYLEAIDALWQLGKKWATTPARWAAAA